MPSKKTLLTIVAFIFFSFRGIGQSRTIHGLVTDSAGKPLGSVSVTVKGTKTGTTTNQQGVFDIAVPASAQKLIIGYVGYNQQEIDISSSSNIQVTLTAAQQALSDVIVVAYGTQKKTSLTAAVSTVSSKEIVKAPVSDVTNALAGRAPGIISKETSGEPGYGTADIKIRGVATIGNANALIIIDGIERPLSYLDPHDIEGFSVLKDAASVAPYGLRGANGVILITTKRGSNQDGKFSLSYDGRYSWDNVTNQPKELSGYDWAVMKNAGATNDGVALPYSGDALQKLKDGSDPDHYANESVTKDLFKTGHLMQHNLSISGGSKNISFFGSVGYLDQDAIWGDVSNYKRYNIRANIDARLSDYTKIGFDLNSGYRDAQYPGAGGAGYIIFGFWRLNPTNPIYYSNGLPAGYFERNPYLDLYNSGYYDEDFYAQSATLRFEQKIPWVDGLALKANFSIDKFDSTIKEWRTPYTFYQIQQDGSFISGTGNVPSPILYDYNGTTRQLTMQVLATYNHTWGNHGIDALAVFEPRKTNSNYLYGQRANYALDIDELNTGSADPADITNGGSSAEATQVGYAYRVSYNYAGKYFVEAAGRYDGHYYFAPDSRYAFFPSFSAGWRLSEEPFLKDSKTINNLKIRGSWGKSGNLAGAPYQYLRQYIYNGSTAYLFGGTSVPSVYESLEPNPNITWEKAVKTDIGVELGLWNGLLNFEGDVFYEKRNDMLNAATTVVPLEYGIGLAQENNSSMENRGIDFQISSRHSFSRDFSVTGAFNFTYAVNKITDIQEAETIRNNPNRSHTGKAYGTQFGYRALGLFQSAEDIAKTPYAASLGYVKPGDVKYEDINNDGVLDANDIVPIGKPLYPEVIYGFNVSINYKHFQLDMLLQGAAKTNYYLTGWAATPFNQSNGVAFEFQENYWTPEHSNAEFPAIRSNPGGYAYNNYTSSFWIRDGSYLRIKTVQLSYDFGKLSVIGLKSARVYVSAQNLLTFTQTKYIDPENPSSTDYYPQTRSIAVGANLNF
ncbi:MAG TPA: TonB-dependent receptor [Parafilimonas sp.]|nr:TonB-dependent receptor [Parafilimonas sp.]